MRFYIADCHFYHEALNTKDGQERICISRQMRVYDAALE